MSEAQDEIAFMDERICVVRDIAKKGLNGELDPHTALATIVQQLIGVSRTPSPGTDDE